MAVMKCSECGGMVSQSATSCPHCGAPSRQYEKTREIQRRNTEGSNKLLALFFGLLAIGGFYLMFTSLIKII